MNRPFHRGYTWTCNYLVGIYENFNFYRASFYVSHWPVLPLQKGSGTKFRMAQCQILPPPFVGCVALGKRQLWNLHL